MTVNVINYWKDFKFRKLFRMPPKRSNIVRSGRHVRQLSPVELLKYLKNETFCGKHDELKPS